MSDANIETAIATATLLRAALERGNREAALTYTERIRSLLLSGEAVDLGTFNSGRRDEKANTVAAA